MGSGFRHQRPGGRHAFGTVDLRRLRAGLPHHACVVRRRSLQLCHSPHRSTASPPTAGSIAPKWAADTGSPITCSARSNTSTRNTTILARPTAWSAESMPSAAHVSTALFWKCRSPSNRWESDHDLQNISKRHPCITVQWRSCTKEGGPSLQWRGCCSLAAPRWIADRMSTAPPARRRRSNRRPPALPQAAEHQSAAIRYVSSADAGEALVSGTSTLHDWTVKSSTIKGNAEFSGQWKAGLRQGRRASIHRPCHPRRFPEEHRRQRHGQHHVRCAEAQEVSRHHL